MSNFEFDTLYSSATGAYVGGYVPHVEDGGSIDADGCDVLIDGAPDNLSEWGQVTGYTQQHGYRGAIFHPSETADDDTIREWVREAGGDVFAIVVVESPCECENPGMDDDCFQCDGSDTSPAGWAIIYRDAE